MALFAAAACGKGKARQEEPAPIPKDAKDASDPAADCAAVFDRFHASLGKHLAQMGLHESAEAARTRDAAGIAACVALPEGKRSCLLAAKVGPDAWASCDVEPPFTLFDATPAHEALLGAPVPAQESAKRVAELAGTWHQPAKGLDDAITWKIGKTGKLESRRTSKRGKHDEPVRQLAIARDRLLAIKHGTSTQFVPFFRDGDTLWLSWTSGAIAVPVADDKAFALDLANAGRWLVWRAPACTIIAPRRGVTTATCVWEDQGEGKASVRTFSIEGDGVAQRWTRHSGALVHPAMETFTRR